MTDTILFNGRMTTLDPTRPSASALAIDNGLFEAVGDDAEIMRRRGPKTTVVDLNRRTVIPGLNDSHTHLIRGGLNYNMELRWDGVASLADALRMLREQARRTPAPQWVRVVGGWREFQFAERRDRARPQRQSDRNADRQAQCDDPVRSARQGPEAAGGAPAQLDPPLH